MRADTQTIPQNVDGSVAGPAHTPGPWRWEVNLKTRKVQLCGGSPRGGFGPYDLTVMDFARWGMNGAQPRFVNGESTALETVDRYCSVVPGREHHAHWFQTVTHPDAALIAAAPELLDALKAMLAHSCVADADPNDKDAEDHDAERMARAAIKKATGT